MAAVVGHQEGAVPGLMNFEDLRGLLRLVDAASAAADDACDLPGQMAALEPEDHEALWRRILDLTGEHLRSERVLANKGGEPADPLSLQVAQAVASLLSSFAGAALNSSQDATLPPSLVETAVLCQEMLLSIPDAKVQALIAGALERICTDAFEGREVFYGGVLMYLIGRCLEPKATVADVGRFHKVRGLLLELDWEHESIESLKMQLMKCTASPNFVRCNHGPELLALFYTVHASFTAEVHSTVKNQVMYVKPGTLKAYSVALFKAWKASEGGTRVQVEHCVQDWVLLAIRTTRKSADRARAMLEEMHRHHHEDQVNDLLCRVYGPLLWRSLKVANWQVRENSARLLQYAFPLIPNELGKADKEQEWLKQVRLLRETLEDPSEPVRRVGIGAVCIVLKNYWGIMPPAEIADLLNVLISRCACDKKAPMVRAAVAEGFSWILDEAITHPTMGQLLSRMAPLMNDKSPVVRAAFVNLLNAVNRCRGMGLSVANVVGTKDLLLRLANEHMEGLAERLQKGLQSSRKPVGSAEVRATPEVVARHMARLIGPSLFLNQDLIQQVNRCRQLMHLYPLGLLALLSHLQDVAPAADRVKLAAALFHYGVKEADTAANLLPDDSPDRPKMVATMLRVVGVLLEGVATEPAKPQRRKRGAHGSRFPKELEAFVYEHIREDDFLHLLKASHEDSGAAARLREDLLFALLPLDPARLPRTAELISHELSVACRGGGASGPIAQPRLAALMRAACRWGLLETALEPAWERLLAAAARLRQRHPAGEETVHTIAVVEAALRDADVRGVVLPAKNEVLKKIVEDVSSAFCDAWSAGAAEVSGSVATGAEQLLLGPAAEVWPRVLGLVFRVALHLEHRLGKQRVVQEAEEAQGAEGAEGAPPVPAATATGSPFAGLAEATQEQLVLALTSERSEALLKALETTAAAARSSEGEPPSKKKNTGPTAALPADVDAALRVHERLLEALNAAHFLSVLAPSAAKPKGGAAAQAEDVAAAAEPAAGGTSHALAPALEDHFWRLACAADVLQPLPDGSSRTARCWVFLGRRLQQLAQTEVPTPDVVAAARRLLGWVCDAAPADDIDLRGALCALFRRLEFEPSLVKLVESMLGNASEEASQQLAAHPRVRAAIIELLPSFRNLRSTFPAHLAGQAAVQPEEHRRILASPTPQQALERRRSSEATDMEFSRRSFSARSRSPPVQDAEGTSEGESLFDTCFTKGQSGAVGTQDPAVSVGGADMSDVGEDAD